MLARPNEPAMTASVRDTIELTETLQTLLDAIKQGVDRRITTQLARKALMASKSVDWRIRDLSIRTAMLEQDAWTDSLTGVLNHRGFEAALHKTLAESRRYEEDGVMLVLELDGFKQINDTLGHMAGDAVLRKVAEILSDNVRESDCIGRLGGNEFAVLMSRTAIEDATIRAASIEWLINTAIIDWHGHPVSILASMSVNHFGASDKGPAIFMRSNHTLYPRKQGRRTSPAASTGIESSVIPITRNKEPVPAGKAG